MEVKRLSAENYDELLDLLNAVFANKYGRDMDFLSEQPKMWVRDDEHMRKHFGIFEDGRLVAVSGIYPLSVKIGGKTLKFATTGNVATHPDYEGRGYFSATFGKSLGHTDFATDPLSLFLCSIYYVFIISHTLDRFFVVI